MIIAEEAHGSILLCPGKLACVKLASLFGCSLSVKREYINKIFLHSQLAIAKFVRRLAGAHSPHLWR